MNDVEIRHFLINEAFKIAENIPEIVSLNIVGSFADSSGHRGISDIDTVIIIDHLTEWKFHEIIEKFRALTIPIYKQYGLNLKINSTFGPLKYNDLNAVVYHVMIYDIARHIIHCRESPFTCFDWERTKIYTKSHISEIHSVYSLMPNHFFNVRRNVNEYLSDFDNSVVSYRYYCFRDGEAIEEEDKKPMTTKDRYEFAFHIMRFVIGNFIKMIEGKNNAYSHNEILDRFINLMPTFQHDLFREFMRISDLKKENRFPENEKDIATLNFLIHSFLERFKDGFDRMFSNDRGMVLFARHERTAMGDGELFFGQRLDPEIIRSNSTDAIKVDRVFHGFSKRSRDTAIFLSSGMEGLADALLNEIDYGDAEGHDYVWLAKHHPEITDAWRYGKDPRFPNGENQQDVINRIKMFIKNLSEFSHSKCLVVTHNVWLRCLIGQSINIPMKDWYRINIPYCRTFTFRFTPEGDLIPDLTSDDIRVLLSSYEMEKFLNYQHQFDPEIRERHNFWKKVNFTNKENAISKHRYFRGTCLVPMAGEGIRYKNFGFETPKPLINVDDGPMIIQAIKCIPRMKKFVYLIRDHMVTDDLTAALKQTSEEVAIVPVCELTEGQACTCLLGMNEVCLDTPLLIASCDNGMIWSDDEYEHLIDSDVELICWTFTKNLTINAKPDAWGYVASDTDMNAIGISVKKPMTDDPYSEHCITGTFWFRTGGLFQELADELIRRGTRVSNEFYVDSIVGIAIDLGKKVKIFDVDRYISWGKPEDLFEYRKWMELEGLYS